MDNKQKAVALLKTLETGAMEPLTYIDPHKYIQHNLSVADGLEGFAALSKMLPAGSVKMNTIRSFQDGEFVFTHNDCDFFGQKIAFDIFRFEDGKIVEHWDNLQDKAVDTNPSGHTMIDGATEIKDLDKTEANKRLVKDTLEIMLSGKGIEKLAAYFNGEEYINHNPKASDGLSGFAKGMAERARMGIVTKYEKVHKVFGEGNFVLAITEGSISGKPTSFYDLFRVENGKIAEHWDVVETILPKDVWKNENGKFNF